MSNAQEVKVTGNAFEYGYKVGDVVKWSSNVETYEVSKDGCAYNAGGHICFAEDPSEYALVKPEKEPFVSKYKTAITTTISLEQGQVESLLIKALGLEGKGVTVEWNQDGSVDVVYKE